MRTKQKRAATRGECFSTGVYEWTTDAKMEKKEVKNEVTVRVEGDLRRRPSYADVIRARRARAACVPGSEQVKVAAVLEHDWRLKRSGAA